MSLKYEPSSEPLHILQVDLKQRGAVFEVFFMLDNSAVFSTMGVSQVQASEKKRYTKIKKFETSGSRNPKHQIQETRNTEFKKPETPNSRKLKHQTARLAVAQLLKHLTPKPQCLI